MINLLPLEEKKEVFAKKKTKLILIFEFGVLLFFVSCLFIFFAIKIYLVGETGPERLAIAQKEKEVDVAQITAFQKEIEAVNSKLQDVEGFYNNQLSITGVLEKVYNNLPQGGYLTSVSFFKSSKKIEMSINGFSPTREKLLEFKNNLEAERGLKKVNFPPSNWAQAENASFSLSFEIGN